MRYIIDGKESMGRAVKMITACICLHNYLIDDELAHEWMEDVAPEIDIPSVDSEGGGYEFTLTSVDRGGERREQACIDLLERTGHI